MIEAVPNVSEGRDDSVIGALADLLVRIEEILLLDVSSDYDHNRTVLTYASENAEALIAATLALFESAVQNIDITSQSGEHPRVGAVDVIPFVPLAGHGMGDAVRVAEEVGSGVSSRFGVPVFLYGSAARDDRRRELPTIRRGGLDGLGKRIGTPDWIPDYGPARLHPTAGASVIGARDLLVAFNVQLDCENLELADEIARAVRESGGGLPRLRALPMRLEQKGLVQVSMNLIDYRTTSIRAAFDLVRVEADKRDVRVCSSEIVGLVPEAALPENPGESILLENPNRELTIEGRILELSKAK